MFSFPADDFIQPIDLTNTTYQYAIKGVKVIPGTRYYFTITAINNVGLANSHTSDGILIDIDTPVAGVIFNTQLHKNVRFLSSSTTLGASWHGFDDHNSFIKFYSIYLVNTLTGSIVAKRKSVGLSNSVRFDNLNLHHGELYYFQMYATDSVFHKSLVVQSEEIFIDTTPPIGLGCQKFGHDVPLYPTKTTSVLETNNRILYTLIYVANLTKDNFYKLSVHADSDVPNLYATVDIGLKHSFSLQFAINRDGTLSSEARFIAMEVNETIIKVEAGVGNIDITLSQCVLKQQNHSATVLVQQIGPSSLSLSSFMLDPESGIKEVLMGVGTTKGGYQVLPLTSVTPNGHFVINTNVHHGSVIYPTALCTNYAGLTTIFKGSPITVDHTPANVKINTAELIIGNIPLPEQKNESLGNDTVVVINVTRSNFTMTDNATSSKSMTVIDLTISFAVVDPQSGVSECSCAVGNYQVFIFHMRSVDHVQ